MDWLVERHIRPRYEDRIRVELVVGIEDASPAGVGAVRKPPRFLQPGDTLETWIEGIGTMRNRIVTAG